ncbi:MAG: hypothetical protein ACRDI2_22410 [Chloroflexota bacterium]
MSKPERSKIVTVEEVERLYPDEWVLMEITRDHRDPMRIKGHLLAHSPDRRALYEPHDRLRAERPDARAFEFYTGDVVAEGVVAAV